MISAGCHLKFDAFPESIHSNKNKRVPAGTPRVGRSIYRIVGTVKKEVALEIAIVKCPKGGCQGGCVL